LIETQICLLEYVEIDFNSGPTKMTKQAMAAVNSECWFKVHPKNHDEMFY